MAATFFKLAFRNMLKHKAFVLVNVLGLGVTLACCIVAYLNYRFEADFNSDQPNLSKIYMVNSFRVLEKEELRYGITPVTLGAALSTSQAKLDNVVRYLPNGTTMRVEGKTEPKVFRQSVVYADTNFFDLFSVKVKLGSLKEFAREGTIIIVNKTAEKFFGKENPVGRIVSLIDSKGKPRDFTVVAVLEDFKNNTMVSFDAITQIGVYFPMFDVNEMAWKDWTGATFLEVSNPQDIPQIEKVLNGFLPMQNRAREDWRVKQFKVFPFAEFTKESRNVRGNWIGADLHPAQIVAPFVMAVLMLLLACFNFMNTSISVANNRIKEIGVRKVVGSSRLQLIGQFLGENALICFMGLLASLYIGQYLTAEYNKMWPYMELNASLVGNWGLWGFALVMLLITAVLAGAYPAFYISSFKPVAVLKGTFKVKGVGWVSKGLLTLQISISLIALISSIVFTQNAVFQDQFNLGYAKDRLVCIPLNGGADGAALKEAMIADPDVESVALTNSHVSYSYFNRSVEQVDKKSEADIFDISPDYLKVIGVKPIEGRDFEPQFAESDANNSAIVNQKLVDELGLKNPIGQRIRLDSLNLTIVGVVSNIYSSVWEKLKPAVFIMHDTKKYELLAVRVRNGEPKSVLESAKKHWVQLVPNVPFDGFLQKERLQESTEVNKNIKLINICLAAIALTLSLIALYTLVSLTVLKRTKEIGIRTILGSSWWSINMLIAKPFVYILLVASVLGGGVGYYLNNALLSVLWAFHASVDVWSILIPVIILFGLSFAILTAKVFYTLSKNPVESLRYE